MGQDVGSLSRSFPNCRDRHGFKTGVDSEASRLNKDYPIVEALLDPSVNNSMHYLVDLV